ncbi:MAG: ABC transporter substrate-binding protein [Coprococcus sp.]
MKKRIMAVVMTAALVMGVLAGCGNSAKETTAPETKAPESQAAETTADTEAGETEAAATGELTHVNVAFMANYASLWEVATAINKGYFEEEGLEVELYMFQDGPTEIASMESGSIDFAYIGPGAHKLCIQGRADIFCFSHLGDADCVMGLKSHGVNSLEDLKGKKVAYASGTSSETILVRALNSVGLTMDDIEAYDMEVSNMVSAIVSGSIDACAPWSPSSATIANELGDDVVKFCSNTTFSDIAADCASWICMPGYADENRDVLVRFTRALYKAMDFGSQEANYDEVAGYVAEACGTDKESALTQTGDGAWLNSEQLLGYVADGTIKGYYEVQQKNFIDAGAVEEEVPVEDYVLFDVMEEAGK